MYASMLVLQHKMLRFDNVGMSILMMFSNVQLYFSHAKQPYIIC